MVYIGKAGTGDIEVEPFYDVQARMRAHFNNGNVSNLLFNSDGHIISAGGSAIDASLHEHPMHFQFSVLCQVPRRDDPEGSAQLIDDVERILIARIGVMEVKYGMDLMFNKKVDQPPQVHTNV
jgi:hypothetical protein